MPWLTCNHRNQINPRQFHIFDISLSGWFHDSCVYCRWFARRHLLLQHLLRSAQGEIWGYCNIVAFYFLQKCAVVVVLFVKNVLSLIRIAWTGSKKCTHLLLAPTTNNLFVYRNGWGVQFPVFQIWCNLYFLSSRSSTRARIVVRAELVLSTTFLTLHAAF